MPTIFDALNIGKSGLYANQMAIDTTGNNVTNANTEGYTKESAVMTTDTPMPTSYGAFGTGVKIAEIQSARNDLIDKSLRSSINDEAYYDKMNSSMDRLQSVFNEMSGVGLKDSMDEFFSSWHALALNPDLETARQQVLDKGQTLTSNINYAYNSLSKLKNDLDNEVGYTVTQINNIAKQIAHLNYEIKKGELGDNEHANTLRDQRGVLLNNLYKLSNVDVMYKAYDANSQPEMTILVGGMPIVSGDSYNELVARKSNGSLYNSVDFVEKNGEMVDITNKIRGGSLGAILNMRDNVIDKYQNELDTMSSSMIQNINKIHASGTGLTAYKQIVGGYSLKSEDAELSSDNATGFDIAVKTGSLNVKITDDNGNNIGTFAVNVNGNDKFSDLRDSFNNILHDYASMNLSNINSGRVQIVAKSGYNISFTYDSSNFLAAAGINTFFSGHSAKDMKINDVVLNDPSKIAAGKTLTPGDSSNAEAIAQVQLKKIMVDNTQSIDEYYNAFLGKIGSEAQGYSNILTSKQSVVKQIKAQQQSIEGVSLDAEAASLIKFQRAYQASAKFISIVNEMTETLIGIVQ